MTCAGLCDVCDTVYLVPAALEGVPFTLSPKYQAGHGLSLVSEKIINEGQFESWIYSVNAIFQLISGFDI